MPVWRPLRPLGCAITLGMLLLFLRSPLLNPSFRDTMHLPMQITRAGHMLTRVLYHIFPCFHRLLHGHPVRRQVEVPTHRGLLCTLPHAHLFNSFRPHNRCPCQYPFSLSPLSDLCRRRSPGCPILSRILSSRRMPSGSSRHQPRLLPYQRHH